MTEVADFLRGYSVTGGAQPESRVPAEFAMLLPSDTVSAAQTASGVRLELRGTAAYLDLRFTVGPAPQRAARSMPAAFSVWLGERHCGVVEVAPGDTRARIPLPQRDMDETVTVYLPEPAVVRLTGLAAGEGTLAPAPLRPRLLAYGDSITQGWSASDPGRAWPAITGARLGMDAVNLGFAGAGRGEHPAAALLAATPADVITLAWGTNSWSTIPADAGLIEHVNRLFLTTVRDGHPDVPIVVLSPIIRPDAERTPNRFGATLADLRAAIESSTEHFRADHDDPALHLIRGEPLLAADLLVDGVHPGDAGHALIADAVIKCLE